jgi:carbon storage regulator CsrA
MLILSRKKNEGLVINDDITITVVEIQEDSVRLGIDVPEEVAVHRQEVLEAIRGERWSGAPSVLRTEGASWQSPGPFIGEFSYERFSAGARKVMEVANDEARRFNLEYVGTEHVLLGLLQETAGVAARVLSDLGIDLSRARGEVEKIIQPGPQPVAAGQLPPTPRVRKVVEFANAEAHELAQNLVETEHLLLGLLREEECVAAQVLANLGISFLVVRRRLMQLLGRFVDPQAFHEIEGIEPPEGWEDFGRSEMPEAARSILKEYDRHIERLQGEKVALGDGESLRVSRLRYEISRLVKSRQILVLLFAGPDG